MSAVFGFHAHQWEPYHLTEIVPFPTTVSGSTVRMIQKPHLRLFECCLICGLARVKNLAPGEIPPMICAEER